MPSRPSAVSCASRRGTLELGDDLGVRHRERRERRQPGFGGAVGDPFRMELRVDVRGDSHRDDAIQVARPRSEGEAIQHVQGAFAFRQRRRRVRCGRRDRENAEERRAAEKTPCERSRECSPSSFDEGATLPDYGPSGLRRRHADVKMSLQWATGAVSPTNAASSASAIRRMPPTSPTSVSTPCSTGDRSRPASPRSTTTGGSTIEREMGYVADVFDEARLSRLPGRTADRPRPLLDGRRLASGQRPADRVRDRPRAARRSPTTATSSTPGRSAPSLERKGALFTTTSDSEVDPSPDRALVRADARRRASPMPFSRCAGRIRSLILSREGIFAVRDPNGIRPLSLGIAGGLARRRLRDLRLRPDRRRRYERDVEPGEIVRLSRDGFTSHPLRLPHSTPCVFEHVYFARPDSLVFGRSVAASREALRRAASRASIRPRPTSSCRFRTRACTRRSATRGSRRSRSPSASCATTTSGARSSSRSRRSAASA